VWAHKPPHRARNVLSGYLSRLRHVLADADGVHISRQPGGYVLAADPMTIDLHRFRGLVIEAREIDDAGNAATLLNQALELWRGEAFATLDTPWLNDVRDALDAERLAAELDRNDLALSAGHHADALGEIAARAIAFPLDERLAGQLMLAFYRCGRQADALAAYQNVRRQLVDELGADPSEPLRQLHDQILRCDAALATPPAIGRAARKPAGTLVPRQLPAPPRSFAGRARQLAELDALLEPNDDHPTAVVISAVSGTGGVGKTALALRWAHQVSDQFPDGQLYLNLRGFDPSGTVMTPGEAVRTLLEAFGTHPQRIPLAFEAQVGMYRSLLAGRRVLVVLDNARDVDHVRPLLPSSPGCLALVTSRNQLTGLVVANDAVPLSLDVLEHDEARALLAKRLGPDRVASEATAADDIITLCAKLPLALAIVAARAATQRQLRLDTLSGEIREMRGRLDAFDTGDASTDVRAVFFWSYRALNSEAARVFRLLGLHPGPHVAAGAAESLAGQPTERVAAVLAELTEANLLTEHPPGRYSFHDLLRVYAAELAATHEAEEDRRAAVHRMLDHYLHTADAADHQLYPHRDPLELPPVRPGAIAIDLSDAEHSLTWFADELPVLLAVVRQAAADGFDTYTWQLPWAMMNFLDRRGHWQDWIQVQLTGLEAAERGADVHGQAVSHRGLEHGYRQVGRYDDAERHGRRALDLYGQLGDRAGQAQIHLGFGATEARLGNYAESLAHTRRAKELYEGAEHQAGLANALNNAGFTHALMGEHERGLELCQRALTLQQQIGDRYMEGAGWDSLGYIQHQLGRYQDAITSYQHALQLVREQGDRYFEADTLHRLGDAHHAAGNHSTARSTWECALAICEELGHPDTDNVRAKVEASIVPR
jgi:DNA-binding SARP family transcriptional activator